MVPVVPAVLVYPDLPLDQEGLPMAPAVQEVQATLPIQQLQRRLFRLYFLHRPFHLCCRWLPFGAPVLHECLYSSGCVDVTRRDVYFFQ